MQAITIGATLPTVQLAKYDHSMKSMETDHHKTPIRMFEFRVPGFVKASCGYILYQLRNFIEAYSFM